MALVPIKRMGISNYDACKKYGVSLDLLKYRMNITGVSRQMKKLA